MFLKWGIFLFVMSMIFFFLGLFSLIGMKVVLLEYYILVLSNWEVKMYFLFDWMSMIFVGVVMLISSMVVIYSEDYMNLEKFKVYFLYGVLIFVSSMVLMILSPNLLMILLGWDGLGFVSYCLVIFYQNYKSSVAGMITILSNRIGDIMILLSLVMLLNFGSLDFMIFSEMYMICGYMLIVAGMTKSAQIPFSAWLPAAMAAPTPVSSLVHSSTLVTAGVYILIRLELLMKVNQYSNFLLFFSILTMMMAGMGALLETDLKKVVALSTLSQLGLMMVILSLGSVDLSFFHLLTHAMFKAMLFLCAGFMIHSSLSNQDIRYMGSFYLMNPFVGIAFSLSNLALFGIPFLSGFYSKDLILEFIYMNKFGFIMLFMIVVSTIFTTVYSLRVMFYSMWKGGIKMVDFSYHWSGYMEIPILIMGIVVIFFGSMLSWILILNYEMIFLNFSSKMLNMIIILMGIWISLLIFQGSEIFNYNVILMFVSKMWFMSLMSSPIFSKNLLKGMKLYEYDNGWLEEIGPQGLYKLNSIISGCVSWVNFSSFKNMIFYLVFVLIFLM
uniref:NADH-ubiquinone oxidoreductase chain 5 n=1 Tax=Subparmatus marinkellei TaxID=1442168 RepID=W0FI20_9ACAR|nr:NADH dehydrogenase subunit 5 [Subparmatus marinkellei]